MADRFCPGTSRFTDERAQLVHYSHHNYSSLVEESHLHHTVIGHAHCRCATDPSPPAVDRGHMRSAVELTRDWYRTRGLHSPRTTCKIVITARWSVLHGRSARSRTAVARGMGSSSARHSLRSAHRQRIELCVVGFGGPAVHQHARCISVHLRGVEPQPTTFVALCPHPGGRCMVRAQGVEPRLRVTGRGAHRADPAGSLLEYRSPFYGSRNRRSSQ